MEPQALLVLCTAPETDGVALTLARGLVEARLAACVNIVGPVRSVYRWQGQVQDEAEVQLLIKTRTELFAAVEQWIGVHHPYEVPELIAFPATRVSQPYLQWLSAQTA